MSRRVRAEIVSDLRNTTWEVLAKSRNRAVLPLLERSVTSDDSTVRTAAISCLLRRRDPESHRLLIQRFDCLNDDDRSVLSETLRAAAHHFAATLKLAVVDDDPRICANACALIVNCEEFHLLPDLVQASTKPRHVDRATILTAITRLSTELSLASRDNSLSRGSRAPDLTIALRNSLVSLERALAVPNIDCRRELIEAYTQLAPSQDSSLICMLRDTRHPCHADLAHLLLSSSTPGVLKTLVDLLSNSDAPSPVLEAVGRRTDYPFLDMLLHRLKHPVSIRVLHNMQQLRTVEWLKVGNVKVLDFDGRAQSMAVELAVASRISQDELFEFLAVVLNQGLTEGRRASCAALARIRSEAADQLIRDALSDPDAAVRVAAIRQLRRRGFPDALQTLVGLIDSDTVDIRDAARSQLTEFNFARFRAMFDVLDHVAGQTTGRLVYKIDPAACQSLLADLAAPSHAIRIRAIDMAVAMSAIDDVCEQLVELSRAENLAVQQAALAALAKSTLPKATEALRLATHDPHPVVRDAARRSMECVPAQIHRGADAVGTEELL